MASTLQRYRSLNIRDSQEVVRLGEEMLESGGVKKLGDELWPFLEQLAIAALDCGKLDLAKVCRDRLEEKFPGSPRVQALVGMIHEGEGRLALAKAFYEKVLAEDENNVAVRKRLISLHVHRYPIPSTSTSVIKSSDSSNSKDDLSLERGIELLVEHLDTVYSDVEGWQQLAEIYASIGQYRHSLACVSDLILLQPQNPFWSLRYAETAFTLGDYKLAYRSYLRTMELSGPMEKGGLGRRAALGLKLSIGRLTDTDGSTNNPSDPSVNSPEQIEAIDALVTKQILDAYSSGQSNNWTPGGPKVSGHVESRSVKAWIARLGGSGI